MKKKLLLLSLCVLSALALKAQDAEKEDEALSISGSVDTYYKYDFSEFKNESGTSNIRTSFDNEQNSVSLGMIDLILKKKVNKASFVGEVSFGPRGQYQSLVAGADGNSFHIQNLYINYAFSDKFLMTAGYMGTFIGYEIISPTGNFNYSTSHLFTNGPFQNAGIKGTYTFSDQVSLMVGLFNDWNAYQDFNGVSDIGAQLFVAPAKGWTAYLNFISGVPSGTEFDLTTSYQISDAFKLGLNAADYKAPDDHGFTGVALYPQYSFSSAFGLGLRGEYFKTKDVGEEKGISTVSFTLSGNVKAGPLTFIPEVRLDKDDQASYFNKNLTATKQAAQLSLAAVYAF
ncbi:MAG: outer membrane beta-barrel protein [Sphingobacteriaceae bacterium]